MHDQMDDGLNIISIPNLAKIQALCLPSLLLNYLPFFANLSNLETLQLHQKIGKIGTLGLHAVLKFYNSDCHCTHFLSTELSKCKKRQSIESNCLPKH